jgi:uncharacterized protein (TIGR03435 family)
MQEVRDTELLRQYVRENSEEAFATLVSRHVNMVYSAALRKTGNPAAAEEITQAVFVIFARKAKKLSRHAALSGWLYQSTRLTASNFLRTEIRRARREQEAYMQSLSNQTESDVWPQIVPLLEDAMGRLGEKDRNALALRFFEGKSFQEIGTAFGASENAAKKRVAYALEKLRKYFSKHGVSSTTATLAGAISANSVQAAPVALAKSVTAVAIAKGAAASGSTLTLIKGALKIMAWTKAKTAIVVGVGVLLAVGTTTVTVKEMAVHRHEVWQEKYDLSVLDKVPPQVSILPSLPSTIQSALRAAGERNGKGLALGQGFQDILGMAYGVRSAHMIVAAPIPEGKYDFIASLFNNDQDNQEALQREIKKKFGLVGRRETIETNVLVLTVQTRDAVGLHRSAGKPSGSQGDDYYSAHDQSIWPLIDYLEHSLNTVVIDKTGLTNNFDIDFKWASTPESLKQVLLDELGLKLTPSRQTVEFVVVEKAN